MRRRRSEVSQVSRLGFELGLLNTAGPTLSTLLSPIVISPREVRSLEDRRTFHPSGRLRPAVSFLHTDARPVVSGPSRNMFPSSAIGFAVPSRVAICVRRKDRREVLFATGGAGRGRRVSSRRRRTAWSDVEC